MQLFYFCFFEENELQQVVAKNRKQASEKMNRIQLNEWDKCYTQSELELLLRNRRIQNLIPLSPIYAR